MRRSSKRKSFRFSRPHPASAPSPFTTRYCDDIRNCLKASAARSSDASDHGVLFSYLLSFGDSVEVLEPASVREQVKEKLISMLRIYKT